MTAYWCERAWLGAGQVAEGVLVEVEGERITEVSSTADSPDAEPATLMAEAALALCVQPPADADGNPGLTGRIAYSQDLLAELGISDVTTRP